MADLTTDLNVSPYWDDFDETDNFHRVLYRPGRAVQVRELTQQQTILQNQINRFGEHFLTDGTIVAGCEIHFDLNYKYVKINDNDNSASPITAAELATYANTIMTGGTSGVTAFVVGTQAGTQAADPNTNTLYIKYTNSGTDGATKTFNNSEVLTSNSGATAVVFTDAASRGTGSAFTIADGIVFAKDHFIRVTKQTIVLDKYSNTPSYKIGYTIDESIVTDTDDTSLLDNASGSFNAAAPGASRLKLTPTLVKKSLTTTSLTDFYELFRVENGVVKSSGQKTEYGQLAKEFARRTFNESGNYTTRPMQVRVREHLDDGSNLGRYTAGNGGDSTKLAIDIQPGKAFVRGFEYETLGTQTVAITKGNTTLAVDSQAIPANYGNYVLVNAVSGLWNLNDLTTVSLRSLAANSIATGTYGATAAPGTELGTADVRALLHESGTQGKHACQFRLYLTNIIMTSGSFSGVRSVYLNNGSGTDAFGDCVREAGLGAVLKETGFNKSVFTIPQSNIKRLTDSSGTVDNTYQYIKEHSVSVSSGAFTISLTGDEDWPVTGTLNATQKNENFVVLADDAMNITLTGTAAKAIYGESANVIGGFSTAFDTELAAGDFVKIGSAGPFKVESVTDANTMTVNTAGAVGTNAITKFIASGKLIDMGGTGSDGARSIVVTGDNAVFDIKESVSGVTAQVVTTQQKTDGVQTTKTLKPHRFVQRNTGNTDVGADTSGPWGLGFSDVYQIRSVRKHTSAFSAKTDGANVTSNFTLDDGQRDNMYDHGRLKLKPDSTLVITSGDKLLVELDYFTHDTSGGEGYLSVDSYPVDDGTPDDDEIKTQEIPLYNSPTTGKQFDLRNCIDIRPIRTNTSFDATTLAAMSTDPANSASYVAVSGGQHMMKPNESFTTDLEYYLPRKDIITIDNKGTISAVTGVPALFPRTPGDLDDAMTLAKIDVAAFPSIAPNVGRDVGRQDLSSSVKQIDNRRYTMRDIGALEQRINRIEYYTSLSMLEKDSADLMILDGTGNNRFKNGVLVDSFTGHNIGNINDSDYKCSIDPVRGEMRPRFTLNNVGLEYNAAGSSTVQRNALDITVTYTETAAFAVDEVVTQTASGATGTIRNLVVDDVDSAVKKMYLEQRTGTWTNSGGITGSATGSGTVTGIETPVPGDLVLLPWTHTKFIEQPFATQGRNAAEELIFHWVGDVDLDPESDHWIDTVTKPELQINFDGNSDAWEQLADAFGAHFGDWENIQGGTGTSSVSLGTTTDTQSLGGGRNLITTTESVATTTTQDQIRTGFSIEVQPETQIDRLGERTVDINIIPWMRARNVNFTATRFKPNTILYPFFDGEGVASYVTKTDSTFANTANEGGTLQTDSVGTLYGTFRVPNNDALRYRVGTKNFRLSDSSTNSNTDVTTSGQSAYTALGMINTVQDTIFSTQVPQVTIDSLSESRTVQDTNITTSSSTRVEQETDWNNWPSDPLTQSFYVSGQTGGVFITKVDLYFKEKHATLPFSVEIREMINGFPGPKIVPLSRKLVNAADVNTSTDASEATPISFNSPVYLQNEQEYALTIRPAGNNTNCVLWAAILGDNNIGTTQRVSEQPEVGILFTSANDRTWSPRQNEDLKFTLYKAAFTTSDTGTVLVTNKDEEFFDVSSLVSTMNGGEIAHGEVKITVSANTAVLNLGETVTGGTSGATGVVNSISGSTYSLKSVPTATKFTTGEALTYSGPGGATLATQTTPKGVVKYYNANQSIIKLHLGTANGTFATAEEITGQVTGATGTIDALYRPQLNTLHPLMQSLVLKGTKITWGVKGTANTTTLDTSFASVTNNEDFDFAEEKEILGRTDEAANLSGNKSIQLQATLTTRSTSISPVIDLSRHGAIVVGNQINDNLDGETGAAGGADAKYITRRVTLDDGQDAEDLKVYLTAYKPTSTEITVYYKILHAEDGESFDDKSWVAMTQDTLSTTFSDTEYKEDFYEFEYSIPTANLTGTNSEVQYTTDAGATFTGYLTFAIKVVLTSPDSSLVPRVRDIRAIALQV